MEEFFIKEKLVPEMRVVNGRWVSGFNTYLEMGAKQKLAFEAMLNEAKTNQFY